METKTFLTIPSRRPRSRLEVVVFDILGRQGAPSAVGLQVVSVDSDGRDWFVNVHPAEVDALIDQLRLAQAASFARFQSLFPERAHPRKKVPSLLRAAISLVTAILQWVGPDEWKLAEQVPAWAKFRTALRAEELRVVQEETKLPNGWFKVKKR